MKRTLTKSERESRKQSDKLYWQNKFKERDIHRNNLAIDNFVNSLDKYISKEVFNKAIRQDLPSNYTNPLITDNNVTNGLKTVQNVSVKGFGKVLSESDLLELLF